VKNHLTFLVSSLNAIVDNGSCFIILHLRYEKVSVVNLSTTFARPFSVCKAQLAVDYSFTLHSGSVHFDQMRNISFDLLCLCDPVHLPLKECCLLCARLLLS
jgi:hypothetical protein